MTRALVTIHTPADRDQVARWAKNVEVGTIVEFRKKSRSNEQNAKLWSMLAEVSEQVVWYGQKLDSEDWKDLFTAALRNARVVPGLDKGSYVPLGMRTSQMTIAEMSDLIELIHAFGADPEHLVTFKDNSDPGASPPPADDAPLASSQEPDPAPSPADQGSTAEPENQQPSSEAQAGSDLSQPQLPDQPPADTGNTEPAASVPSAKAVGSSLFSLCIEDDELQHLIDFARKGLSEAIAEKDAPTKLVFMENMRLNYLDAVESKNGRGCIDAISKALSAVINGKRTAEQAAGYICRDVLDCDVEELEVRHG